MKALWLYALLFPLAVTAAPANDNFTSATVLTGTSTTALGDSTDATKESGEPDHAGISGGTSIWWNWTAPTTGTVLLSTRGTAFDTLLATYTGNVVNVLGGVASNDDQKPNEVKTGRLTFTATAGQTYQIAVDGYGGENGPVNLTLLQPTRVADAVSWVGAFFGTRGEQPVYLADVTGDGLADAIVINENSITVRPSNGSSFLGPQTWTNAFYNLDPGAGRGTFFADVTGDGFADAVVVNNSGILVRRSTGVSFGATEVWTGAFFGSRGTFLVDVTGDGSADAVVINDTGITVRRSNGGGFNNAETWSDAFFGSRGTFLADVTGDGLTDAIAVNDTSTTVRRGNGARFTANETWSGAFYNTDAGVGRGTFLGDVTGDGLADAVVVNSAGVFIQRSTGTAFAGTEPWASTASFGNLATGLADVTGDQTADVVAVNTAGVLVRRVD